MFQKVLLVLFVIASFNVVYLEGFVPVKGLHLQSGNMSQDRTKALANTSLLFRLRGKPHVFV